MKLDEVKEGATLIADDGFTCLHEGQKCQVRKDDLGLYINCDSGKHHLYGQTDFETGTRLVGLVEASGSAESV